MKKPKPRPRKVYAPDEKPSGLVWVPANNWGAGDWQDSDGNTWVERSGKWQNWGRAS